MPSPRLFSTEIWTSSVSIFFLFKEVQWSQHFQTDEYWSERPNCDNLMTYEIDRRCFILRCLAIRWFKKPDTNYDEITIKISWNFVSSTKPRSSGGFCRRRKSNPDPHRKCSPFALQTSGKNILLFRLFLIPKCRSWKSAVQSYRFPVLVNPSLPRRLSIPLGDGSLFFRLATLMRRRRSVWSAKMKDVRNWNSARVTSSLSGSITHHHHRFLVY